MTSNAAFMLSSVLIRTRANGSWSSTRTIQERRLSLHGMWEIAPTPVLPLLPLRPALQDLEQGRADKTMMTRSGGVDSKPYTWYTCAECSSKYAYMCIYVFFFATKGENIKERAAPTDGKESASDLHNRCIYFQDRPRCHLSRIRRRQAASS